MTRYSALALLFAVCMLSSFTETTVAQNKKANGQANKHPHWIWLKEGDRLPAKVMFRKQLTLPANIRSATLYGTCDNTFKVFLNGKQVLQSTTWSEPVSVDLTNQLKGTREHTLAVEATNEGNSPAGLVMNLVVNANTRNPRHFVTDMTWRASTEAAQGWKSADFDDGQWKTVQSVGRIGAGPWTGITVTSLLQPLKQRQPQATPLEAMNIAKDFRVELLYSVPKDQQGSWVSMCTDPKGRLIVSDQNGGLFRVTPPALGSSAPVKIEKIQGDIGEAQGLLWAFDSLYVVVNRGGKYQSGVYRVLDTDGDDQLDKLVTLRTLNGGGEHGPHAVLLTPDKKSLYIVCGNGTRLTDIASSRVPQVWDEDVLLPRVQGRFMVGARAPGGYISRIDPDGKNWELVATGFRNEYDAALNADGELFSYDADMEWDMNTPWYRATRVCHVVSGAEFGWRSNSAKWPAYYPDSVPAVVDIGPGSPTGICFGYGARFPAKYQKALFIADWSYGKLYAVHMKPQGSTYTANIEEFIAGTPLPLTDLVVNPVDGALYFAIGGRKVQSGLYRVTYAGPETHDVLADYHEPLAAKSRALRKSLEALHVGDHPDAVDKAWPHLGSPDRFIRYAARIAIEHRPTEEWADRALNETDPHRGLHALLALARQQQREPRGEGRIIDSPLPSWLNPRTASSPLQTKILAALDRFDWQALSAEQRLLLMRAYTVTFCRLGPPSSEAREHLIKKFDKLVPQESNELNVELARMLVYFQADSAATKVVGLLDASRTQEGQIEFAKTLRHLNVGWTPDLQKRYFSWFVKATGFRGGNSFGIFVNNIKNDAVTKLSAPQKQMLRPILEAKPEGAVTAVAVKPRPVVKQYEFDELLNLMTDGLQGRDFENGKKMFAAANCFACHRFDQQGGAMGPDLTGLAG